jgi:hypothetical protein
MKSIIKQLLRESLLSEKLTDIDDDVNMIYTKYFEYDIKEVERTGIIRDNMFLYSETNTDILKSKECVDAHSVNACVIKMNTGSNYYQPKSNTLSFSINDNAVDYVKGEAGCNLNLAVSLLHTDAQKSSLRAEFTEEKMKGSIHHELAHWLDDTHHNQHINKRLNKAQEFKTKDLGGIPVNSTKMEIQGQIHNVKQLYNKYKDIWDTLSFYDMLKYSPPLTSVFNGLSGDIKTKWIRELKTRMHREGLLGKNMA